MQRLLALMIALALLIVPVGMIGGMASAHVSGGDAVTTAPACHEGSPKPAKPAKGLGMSAECALACAALPAMPARLADRLLPVAPPPLATVRMVVAKTSPESIDPPPRA